MAVRTHARLGVMLAAAAAVLATALAVPSSAATPPELVSGAHPTANLHASSRVVYHYDRSHYANRRPSTSANMTYHGGKIMPTSNTKAIFWGTSWAAYSGDKMTGLDSWYGGFSNSHYAQTSTEYTGSNGQVGPTSSYSGHTVDTSAASGGGNTSAILAEVAKQITSPDPSGNGYYPVYSDLARGNANYCAWHSSGTIGTTPVQFAFFWKLDGDSGCDPQDTTTGHSQGLAALVNVTGHELSEATTDPATPPAWYDSAGYENGDKCAWTFNVPSVTLANGTAWKIQGEWSNAAYTARTGYSNSSGQPGCLNGQ